MKRWQAQLSSRHIYLGPECIAAIHKCQINKSAKYQFDLIQSVNCPALNKHESWQWHELLKCNTTNWQKPQYTLAPMLWYNNV